MNHQIAHARTGNGQPSMVAISRYLFGLLISISGVALCVWLIPLLGDHAAFITIFAAVMFAARYLGRGPTIVTVAAATLGIWFWIPSAGESAIHKILGVVAFLLFSCVIIAFGEATRRSKIKQAKTGQALRESEARLKLALQDMQCEIERRAHEIERKTEQTAEQAKLLDLANDAIVVRTARDRVAYWNKGAERLYGWTKEEALGRSTHELLHTRFPFPSSQIQDSDRWEGELRQVKRDGSEITVANRWTTLRDRDGRFSGGLEINTDITARRRAEDAARRLSGRILSLQDDERRRIARELHDSLGQYLVSLKVNLDLLSGAAHEERESGLIAECLNDVRSCISDMRTISHLLHPPLLDEAGLASAARWYVEGFAERSGLEVNLDIAPDLERLDRDVETTLFRILQEALTNIHRHAGESIVRIMLQVDAEQVYLEVSDNGKGIPTERLRRLRENDSPTGVGLAGMRERVRDLGGSLTVSSASPGTTIAVAIPLLQNAEQSSGSAKFKDSNSHASAA